MKAYRSLFALIAIHWLLVATSDAAIIYSGLQNISISSASGFAGSSKHIGLGPDQFISGDDGYIGFRFFTNANDGPYYGWMRLNLSNAVADGFIRDWAYDDSGASISVGAVPETSSILAVIVGSLGFCIR